MTEQLRREFYIETIDISSDTTSDTSPRQSWEGQDSNTTSPRQSWEGQDPNISLDWDVHPNFSLYIHMGEEITIFRQRIIVPKKVINLPTQFYNKATCCEKSCPICLAEYKEDSDIIICPCNHVFDYACIHEWVNINENCPICRRSIPIVEDPHSILAQRLAAENFAMNIP